MNNIKENFKSIPLALENSDNKSIVDYLFANDNKLLTAFGRSLELPRETQNLLAFFSDGSIIISRTHKYDGRILAFSELLTRKGIQSKTPFYSDLGLIAAIYNRNAEKHGKHNALDYDNQMQKDFVDIISRAASMKVTDVHIEVADQTSVYFRMDGSIELITENSTAWGESFVRAAFASSDISNTNYAQNEYQSAQKDGHTPLRGTKDLYLPTGVLGIRMQFNPIAFGTRYVVMRILYDNPSEGIKTEQEFGEYEQDLLFQIHYLGSVRCIPKNYIGLGFVKIIW